MTHEEMKKFLENMNYYTNIYSKEYQYIRKWLPLSNQNSEKDREICRLAKSNGF